MADDKKNIPEAASPAEAHAPTVENAIVPEQPAPEPALTDAEVVMLENGRGFALGHNPAAPSPYVTWACYMTRTASDIGTFPKPPRNAPDEIVNYDQRVPVENRSFLAWGHLTYTRPLTKRQASDYELRPAPDNPDRPRSIREQMKTAVKQAKADRGQAAPKKNAPDRGDR